MELKAGTYRYRTVVTMMGREQVVESSVVIEEIPDGWRVTEESGASGSDSALLDKGTLALRSRVMTAGPSKLELECSGGRISGSFLMMNGQTREISADLEGELFAYGPGAAQSIAALPLAEGYATCFRTFDVPSQTFPMRQLAVVEAGPEVFRVEITPGEWTLWIDRASRHVVKVSRTAGGMSMISELTVR
jgi:hypothetical protein